MNKHLKPDRNTNLNNPRSEVDRSDCNLRLGWSSMEQKKNFRWQNLDLDWNTTKMYTVNYPCLWLGVKTCDIRFRCFDLFLARAGIWLLFNGLLVPLLSLLYVIIL